MKITKLWVVKDPTPDSEMIDIVFEMDMNKLGNYIAGGPHGAWAKENHTAYTEEGEAKKDAGLRMKARNEKTASVDPLTLRVAARFADL